MPALALGALPPAAAAAAAAADPNEVAKKLKEIPAGARLLLAEDCLSLVVVLLTELPRPAGRASARGSLRREVVHRLASSECTHSEVAAVTANLMEVRGGWGVGVGEGGGVGAGDDWRVGGFKIVAWSVRGGSRKERGDVVFLRP